ncbi:MAG: sporulation integral membrane protein YtvI [Lachnospiraceae bacterium]|nr:sporulation integral membrane protein YtvI [Lachnospiraceae bacterium]
MKQSTKYLKILVNLLVALFTIVCLCFVFPKLIVFFMPFVVGWIISMIANPLVRFLEKRVKIVRKHGSMMIIIGVLAAVIGLGYLGVSRLFVEAGNLIAHLPQMYGNLQEDFEEIGRNLEVFYSRLPEDTQEQLAEIGSDFTGYLGGLVQAIGEPTFAAAGNFAKNVPATLIAIIMSILSAYFFTAERDAILAEVKKNVPASVWDRVSGVIYDLKRVVGGYFKAQFKIMGVVYVLLVIGLFILHMDYVLLVAFLIAFLDMLPFFGTGTVLWPWAAIKILSGDYRIAVGLIILYAVTQIVRQVIQPKIVGDTIGMNPLATLIFMYIGYKVSSIGGMIVAVPVGMILINLYQSGVFDNQIRCIRELVNDINEFRKF